MSGTAHPDGWGIGFYSNHNPVVERRKSAAYADLHFSTTAERVYAHTVLAHVRRATVGGPALANSHPFRYGRWLFAHNGTICAFDQVGSVLEADVASEFLAHRKGSTDSELLFLWLLDQMRRAGIDLAKDHVDAGRLAHLIRDSIVYVASLCQRQSPNEVEKLNVLLTNGSVLLASRWNHSLYWVARDGIHDCEICGIPHVKHSSNVAYRAVVIASEPISQETWLEIPNHSVLCVDTHLGTSFHPA